MQKATAHLGIPVARSRYQNYAFALLIITIICFVLQLAIPGFTEWFYLKSTDAFVRPWMFLSALFMHAGIWHIAFNMLGLVIFGPLLEQQIGSRRFLFVYLAGGIFANVATFRYYPAALGASGAIMAMLGTLIVLMPRLQVLIYGIIPMPLWTAGILWFILDTLTVVTPGSNIGGLAHIAGMGFGLLVGWHLLSQKKRSFKRVKAKKDLSSDDVDDLVKRYM